MRSIRFAVFLAAVLAVPAACAIAQATGQGRAIITVFAKHSEVAPNIAQQDVSAKVNGKDVGITGWTQFKSPDDALELVVLIDSGARNLGRQFDEIKQFVQGLGPHTKISVGYMQNGRSVLAGPLSADHNQVVGELHLPAGPNTNPYFSLSDLAQHWPSNDRNARREVLLLSDGVDPENRRFDPDDPYVLSAIKDSARAGLVVYTLYWRSADRGDSSMTLDGGQSLLNEISSATGGYSYWSGSGNPVSFQPYFDDLNKRFANQYSLEFTTRLEKKPEVEPFKLKIEGLSLQVAAPTQVNVDHAGQQ